MANKTREEIAKSANLIMTSFISACFRNAHDGALDSAL
jgi:hypothetical protein